MTDPPLTHLTRFTHLTSLTARHLSASLSQPRPSNSLSIPKHTPRLFFTPSPVTSLPITSLTIPHSFKVFHPLILNLHHPANHPERILTHPLHQCAPSILWTSTSSPSLPPPPPSPTRSSHLFQSQHARWRRLARSGSAGRGMASAYWKLVSTIVKMA
ncbi:hypothetical protein E2C01_049165 [Portunus trituberculatus]|uniref:Uncharacterized protein n=1 Tax=Portunus trituberculatus TaxID=210409 RepID=A0A5B7GD72_PORTR|nr:hypothetical protein [Portunus trituberculatus]